MAHYWLQIETEDHGNHHFVDTRGLEQLTPIILLSAVQKQSFRGEPEARTNGSELIAILNDTFSNSFESDPSWTLLNALSVRLTMLNIIFTTVVKLVITNLFEQITLTMRAVIHCFQWSVKTTFKKQPFFFQGFSVDFCLSSCLQVAQQLCFFFWPHIVCYIKSYS